MTADLWIVDTNVVVSGVIAHDAQSPAATILDQMLAASIRFVLCEELVAEYRDVLLRPRIARLHRLKESEVDQLLEALIANAVIVDIAGRTEAAPDPGDDHLWRLLAAQPGAGLITGDGLLIKHPSPAGRVLSPRAYLDSM